MSRSAQNSGKPKGQGGAAKKNNGPDRPGASGHRFGPDLACSECGILWDVHQREPKPCKIDKVVDVFTRRPSGDFENSAKADNATGTGDTETAETATEAAKTVAKSTNKD